MTRGLPRLLSLLVLFAAACSTSADTSTTVPPIPTTEVEPVATGPAPVIVDYSPTVSDVGALLYLLSHPGVDVLAITLPGTGEAGCDLGYEVTFGILAMFGRDDIPVTCDPDLPPDAEQWPAEFLAGADSLTFGLPNSDAVPDPRSPDQLIVETISGSDEPVTIYAVAPLTNIARAFERHPEVVGEVDRVAIMGGAVDAAGNVQGTGAEWNLYIDAPAAAAVLSSGANVTLVPLDATNDVPVPGLWQSDLEAAEQSDAVAYLTSLVRIFPAVTSGFFYLWDELAAAVAAGEDLVDSEEVKLTVGEDGSTVRDPDGAPILVATAVRDPAGFYAHFLSTISGGPMAPRTALVFDETTAPDAIDAGSSPEEVLAYWLVRGFEGDVDGSASVVAPGAPWVGFGDSPHAYVVGAQPYEPFDMELACTSDGQVVLCDMTFVDLWIAPIPELERGAVSVEAEVADGMIVAFRALAFDAGTAAAFGAHSAWLEAEQPALFAEACAANPFGRECSEMFVTTVEDWVTSR